MNPGNADAHALPHGTAKRTLPWIFLAGIALSIRLCRLDHFSYWLDEVLQTFTIRSSWHDLWGSLRRQGLHAPLDYVLLKIVEGIHPSDAVRRIPAALWGTGCVLAFGALLARRGGRPIGLACAALLALAPYHVRYSQEVRPYSLGLFLLTASLLALDFYLERPNSLRLGLFYFGCLATIYALYLAGLVLFITAGSLIVLDGFDSEQARRVSARRFLLWSPAFIAAVAVGYFPWWSVLLRAIRSPADSAPPGFGFARLIRWFSYFGFTGQDGASLGGAELLFLALSVTGAVVASRRPRLRFLLPWVLLGLTTIEVLEHRHSEFDSIFHWLPAGLGLTALSGVGLASIIRVRVLWPGKALLLAALMLVDVRSLAAYFRTGRPDWRPVARYLASTPAGERIFVENPYTLFCVAHYLCGPDWPPCKKAGNREVLAVHGDLPTLLQAWDRRRDAWLVLAAGPRSEALRSWSSEFPSVRFPTAEGGGGAFVRRLHAAGVTR